VIWAPGNPEAMLLRDDLAARLERLKARLAEQLQEAENTRTHIGEIRAQLEATDVAHAPDSSHSIPKSPAEKVALFRSLFRGREDVYPRLWVSAKRDRKGYSPVCANEGRRA